VRPESRRSIRAASAGLSGLPEDVVVEGYGGVRAEDGGLRVAEFVEDGLGFFAASRVT